MSNLVRASRELFSRTPDETFDTFDQLYQYCSTLQEHSSDRWEPPQSVTPAILDSGQLGLTIGSYGQFAMNDWSFGQLCGLSRVDKQTINRLQTQTALQAFRDTMPHGRKPLQVLITDDRVRSVHGVSYTRLFNSELLDMVRDHAGDFTPPQKGFNGATGLYAGEQDMFCFLIDPSGWVEIGGESFAPGFFLWNSEVGRRTVGIETFWFQSVCANHIVWDAMEVTTFSRKHTANVHDALPEITGLLKQLVVSRDQRRDAFVRQMTAAQTSVLGQDQEETMKTLSGRGIPQHVVKEAMKMVTSSGSRFTVFALVDALTRISGRIKQAGDRAELDARIGRLLTLAV
ncbi:MAG: hypothetical protein U0996_21890 [Planctomycetaceae bacterium]